MAQKFTGGIGNKLSGECGAGRAGRGGLRYRARARARDAAGSARGPRFPAAARPERVWARRAADRPVLAVLVQPCSTETRTSPPTAARAWPRGALPGKSPAPATRNPAAAAARRSTTPFCTQQVRAQRGPGALPAHLPAHLPAASAPRTRGGCRRWNPKPSGTRGRPPRVLRGRAALPAAGGEACMCPGWPWLPRVLGRWGEHSILEAC